MVNPIRSKMFFSLVRLVLPVDLVLVGLCGYIWNCLLIDGI